MKLRKILKKLANSIYDFRACTKCKVVFWYHGQKTFAHQTANVKRLKDLFPIGHSKWNFRDDVFQFFNCDCILEYMRPHLAIYPFDCSKECTLSLDHKEKLKKLQDLLSGKNTHGNQGDEESSVSVNESISENIPMYTRRWIKDLEPAIKGKFIQLNCLAHQKLTCDIVQAMDIVLEVEIKAEDGYEHYQTLCEQHKKIKLWLHQYDLPDDLQAGIEKLRDRVGNAIDDYCHTRMLRFLTDDEDEESDK